ncbi:transcriptional regulator, LacI family [Sulfobacillus thermosulfidooxidans DSM 9293]|uniref:Transcriptional regulator, LacI family n=1 Tax=Sulfobacillus thermosulfidooxidans (strain DSM 9293 / VKM B-1269 / AT-1) TaxID=929705 RepID=A0A1W1WEI2_SULTA|nr:substrate-binding domain-containing protein [Sulfobacillus thermosulfidooxidans]SMC04676.1 transcriptional regulator, LacI family [Sulfobacillus thermosulfidooxidans DSM 9293]
MATIKDVARRAGVGVATVSRALNRTGYVKSETLHKIEQAMAELGYIPNRQARAMVGGSTMTIGVLVPDMDNSLFMRIVQAINDAAYRYDYTLLVMDSRGEAEREAKIVRAMQELRVDGLILFGTPGTHEVLNHLSPTGPLVILDRLIPSFPGPQVSVNHYEGAKIAVNLLLQYCHFPPAFIAGPYHVSSAQERYKGYQDVLYDHQISIDQNRIEPADFTYQAGYEAMQRLIARVSDLDGVFAVNDLAALGAMKAIYEHGLRCPDDIRLVGFDDIHAARYVTPSLTTIRQPMEAIGESAVNIVLKQIHGELVDTKPIVLPGKLIRRESC